MTIEEIIESADPTALSCDGFDEAIIGTDTNGRLVYNINEMVQVLVRNDGMKEETAIEYLDFNTLYAYVGEMTPVFIYLETQ